MISWQEFKKSGFEIRLWDDELIEQFIKENYPFALQAFLNARNHAEAADIARYAIIHHYGGLYVDWDIKLLSKKKFTELIANNPNGFLVIDPVNQTLASECFAAQSGEPYLLRLLDNIAYIYECNFRDSLPTPQYSGPFRMREVFFFLKQDSAQTLLPVKDVFLYDYLEIRVKPPRSKAVPMIHYWEHSWF
jgi:hypothetical protein